MPAPRSVCWAMVASRSCAVSVSGFSAGRGSRRRRARGRGRPGRAAGAAGQSPSTSARSTMRVLALEMSRPGLDDRRADQHVELASPRSRRSPARAACSFICPCATATRASGTSSRSRARPSRSTRPGCARRRPGPRAAARGGSRRDLLLVVGPDVGQHRVPLLGRRGIVDISRMPVTAISRVRGIGVADIAARRRWCAALELLLVLDAEALLLVDDDQPEVLEPDLAAEAAGGCR
jgi:hypothetical protein